MPAPDFIDDRRILNASVVEAGRLALDLFRSGVRRSAKADGTPVTEADIAVDTFLRTSLLAARPSYGWLSEETMDDPARLRTERVWIVDPIDGTVSFLKGGDEWMVSVALVESGRPVLAALVNPVRGEFFEAGRGGGAMRNGSAISASQRGDLPGCRMLANVAAFAPERWTEPWPDMVRNSCRSMAYRICQVAEGRVDATLAISRKHDWDLAAAHLVLEEAGGRLTTLDGGEIYYNRVSTRHATTVAAGVELHRALVARSKHFVSRAA